MRFCKPLTHLTHPFLPRSNMKLNTVIRWLDPETTIALDLDPATTTIATVQALVADEIKARWRSLGRRVFRDSLPASAVTLRHAQRELDPDEILNGCRIKENSMIEAAIQRTHGETELIQARARKGQEMERRKMERKKAREERKAHTEGAQTLPLPQQKSEEQVKDEEVREAEELSDDARRALDEDLMVMEEDLRVIEERDERELEEARQAAGFRIAAEYSDEVLVAPTLEEDPFDEEDADKENWNPQILRNVLDNQR